MQLDDINIFDYKAPTPEEILADGPRANATPIDPYERFQQERSQLSLDPVKRTLQRAGQGLGSLFAVETPLDYALSGLAAAKPVVAAGKGIAAIAKQAEPKDMVFVHNTSEEAIKSFDNMGGIPSPSIAVTKSDQPFIGYGKIQLIGRPEKFDPLVDPRNKIYSSDAYTPRAPKKLRLAKDDAAENFAKDFSYLDKIDDTMPAKDAYVYNRIITTEKLQKMKSPTLRADSLEDGLDSLDRFLRSPPSTRKFMKEIGRDPNDLKNLDKPFPQIKFNKWVNEQKDKYLSKDGVFTYFDDFDETTRTMPYTLDNVVENMVQERQRGGEGDLGFFGDNRLMALTSESFKDLPGVKAQKDRLVEKAIGSTGAVEDDIFQSIMKNLPDEDLVKAQQINYPRIEDVRRIAENEASYTATQLTEAIGQNLEYGMDLPKAIKTAYTEKEDLLELPKMMPGALFDDIEQALIKNATRPVEYFEAKPTRAVGFDEFAGAIVPENTSKEEFINDMQNWIKNPTEKNVKMRGAVRKFGLMPKQVFSEEDIKRSRRAYFANISYLDDKIGEILQVLEDTRQEAIILFVSDHGDMLGERGLWFKMSFYEGSARVPLMISAPQMEAGLVSTPVSNIDVCPTLCDLAGVSIDEVAPWTTGESLVHMGQGGTRDTPVAIEYAAEASYAPMVSLRYGKWKYNRCALDPDQLFDLESDPHELRNLAVVAEHQGTLTSLRAKSEARWDLERFDQDVRQSQAKRWIVYEALRQGGYYPWDYQPLQQASERYMRNHMDLNVLEESKRFPRGE